MPDTQTREIAIDKKYLLLPVRNGVRTARVDLVIDGKAVRQFDIELAARAEPSFWSFLDLTPFKGKKATLQVVGASKEAVDTIVQSDKLRMPENLYDEPMRPQFHFSQMIGWNNDPNGMVYYDGRWHLYFQHNPYGWKWGNMHWGHAVSKDLVHWQQLPVAIHNYRRGDWAFSGSAAVDQNNTAGWQKGKDKVIVAAWTSTGRGECIAYSNDRGRTFTEYEGNPVVKHSGRDPKIIWHEPTKKWVMAVFDQRKKGRGIAFHTSPDLKKWQFASRIDGYFECPEIFELPVDPPSSPGDSGVAGGDAKNTRWVIYAADAKYAVGKFDGKVFSPEHQGKHRVHYGHYYASQTFSDPPDGRRIQIGWARITMKGMPFNQMMGFPTLLTLRKTPDGIRMFAKPVKEIELIHGKKHACEAQTIADGKELAIGAAGDLFDIRAEFTAGKAGSFGIKVPGADVIYDVKAKTVSAGRVKAPLAPVDGKVRLQILVDRPSVEVCGNDGRIYITSPRGKGQTKGVKVFARQAEAKLNSLEVFELKSAWKK